METYGGTPSTRAEDEEPRKHIKECLKISSVPGRKVSGPCVSQLGAPDTERGPWALWDEVQTKWNLISGT